MRMRLTTSKISNPIDNLIIVATIIYYVLIDAVGIIVGAEGSRLGGMILIGQLLILALLYILQSRGRILIRPSTFYLYFLLFIGYCFINCCFWSTYFNQSLARSEQLAEMAVLMIIVYTVFDGRENAVDDLLTVIMLGGFFLVAAYIMVYGWTYIIFSLRNADRISSDIINANTLGMAAAYSCVIFFHRLLQKKIHVWWIPFLILSFITLLASQSRKAFLIVVLGALGVFFLNNHKDKNKLRSLGRLLAMIIVLTVLIIVLERNGVLTGIIDRLSGLISFFNGNGLIDKSTLQRSTLVTLGLDLFKQNPVGGIGIDCARYFSPYGYAYHLHNNYVELLADGGIIGLIVYYWLYLVILISMLKHRNFDDPEFNVCFVILIIRLIMDYGFFSYKEQGTYFFLLLFYLYYKRLKQKSENIMSPLMK